ncbi:hypothetical protein HK102_005486 [Quaeritorhiza haematococci]|nr:hypothetical protein HK102_005486 [Quaeritorhiza haematococci]
MPSHVWDLQPPAAPGGTGETGETVDAVQEEMMGFEWMDDGDDMAEDGNTKRRSPDGTECQDADDEHRGKKRQKGGREGRKRATQHCREAPSNSGLTSMTTSTDPSFSAFSLNHATLVDSTLSSSIPGAPSMLPFPFFDLLDSIPSSESDAEGEPDDEEDQDDFDNAVSVWAEMHGAISIPTTPSANLAATGSGFDVLLGSSGSLLSSASSEMLANPITTDEHNSGSLSSTSSLSPMLKDFQCSASYSHFFDFSLNSELHQKLGSQPLKTATHHLEASAFFTTAPLSFCLNSADHGHQPHLPGATLTSVPMQSKTTIPASHINHAMAAMPTPVGTPSPPSSFHQTLTTPTMSTTAVHGDTCDAVMGLPIGLTNLGLFWA